MNPNTLYYLWRLLRKLPVLIKSALVSQHKTLLLHNSHYWMVQIQ